MNNFVAFKGISPFDLALALFMTFLAVAESGYTLGASLRTDVLMYVASIFGVLGTFFRRTHPLPGALAVYLGALLRYIAVPGVVLLQDTAVLFALYAVLVYGPRAARIPAIAGAAFGALLLTIPTFWTTLSPPLVVLTVFAAQAIVFATMAGALLRRQQFTRFDLLVEDAHVAQQNAEREAELAVIGERTRIAREMHDIVAHTLSIVIAQADGGKYAAKSNPEAAEQALDIIGEMSRAALGDIRSIIGVLRDPDDLDAPLAPQPIDSDLLALTEHIRASGHDVSYLVTGVSRPLPVGIGHALYRICQEALTNSLKHAGPEAKISIAVHWHPSEVVMDVSDNGRGAATVNDGHGHGLIGMNERAAVFGGSVVSGPRQSGGFRVTAVIPTPGERNTHV